jgi:2-hydroxymuconate-semialdehyde hydrolase
MISGPVHGAIRHDLEVDGLITSYLEAGTGPMVLLLHSGEYGASAELSWEYTIPVLSRRYHVIAPDWLGYGWTAKVHDFERGTGRLLSHMGRLCQELGLDRVPVVASSLGASLALADASSVRPRLPASSIVAICGGGEIARNKHVDALFDYDGSVGAMRRIVEALFEDPSWADESYIQRRHEQSMIPGAWECVSAPRFRPPALGAVTSRPKPAYENISVPTLLIAGDRDKIKPSGWANDLQARIPSCEVFVVLGAGHLPHIEDPETVHPAILDFLDKH